MPGDSSTSWDLQQLRGSKRAHESALETWQDTPNFDSPAGNGGKHGAVRRGG
jgi:hypothetical protein